MKYVIDKEKRPVYLQLYNQIREDIVNDVLRFDSKLPSIRALAEELGVRYLNTAEVLKDDNGFLMSELDVGDGHHLSAEAYLRMLEYIRTHGYK